ncbi:MAG: YggS family pyridoxal phosphate-dependent enzyme [Elusimicrobia bacterium CG_4_10_14_0_2_um_filter_56_8]|nr:MAG: YggS family pyridoxal phosphate enzyme [Elusimicrobia bacterium CG1_02_56_21]PJA14382.1 MAG: YggS family pyridoxal phosphate-dependent enzyme [Elusimicrobia bacterium CG_4_10_14_0_2_um_filter_56_8]
MPNAELTRKSALLSNFHHITDRINSACGRAEAGPAVAELLAVTKYARPEDVKILIEAGAIKIAGESKIQDARSRWVTGELAPLKSRIKLHFIGHLQTNKAKAAVETFDWIDSIDSVKIAAEINRRAAALGRTIPVMIQLKLSSSAAQSGIAPDKAGELLAGIRTFSNLEPRGYMGIAPADASPEQLKTVFKEAKKIFDRDFPVPAGSGPRNYLSLGMSGDYELAVEAGSNLPRIGSALFA